MKKHLPFKIRLLLSFWLVIVLSLLVPFLYYYKILKEEILNEAKTNALHQLESIQWLILHNSALVDSGSLDRWCTEVGERLGTRITYITEGGKVIADSKVSFPRIDNMDNHGSRPEVIQARTQEIGMSIRYSATIKTNWIYAAKRIIPQKMIPPGIVRVAIPFSKVQNRLESLTRSFWIITGLTFVLSTLLAYALARRLGHPVQEIVQAAEAMSGGDFKQRIYFYPNQEFYPLAESLNRMATHIEVHIETVTDQKRQFEAILNGMKEGVMFLDAHGRIRATNQSLTSILPNPPAVIGRQPMEVLLSPELQAACERVLKDKEHEHLEIELENEKFYEINIVQVSDLKKEGGAVVVFHDISELKRLEKVRRDFVANVSHELRTPLTSIKGYTETLLSDSSMDKADIQSFLETILKNTNNMSKMVNDLLQLAKLEGQTFNGSLTSVDVAAVLNIAWETCKPMAKEKNIQLENHLSERNATVYADLEQLIEVFQNLLENAIRHSPPGEKIRVFLHEDNDDITLSIQDKGSGISKAHQNRIFERFYRVDKHRTNAYGGTGLGLAICRHIMRNHGGRIWVESRPGEGATFSFTLKRVNSEESS